MKTLLLVFIGFMLGITANAETKQYEVNGVKFNMVYVQGGTFVMGSMMNDKTAEEDETKHKVVLSNYYIGETEVTQELWSAVMERNPSYFKRDSLFPVESISYDEANDFIEKLNLMTGETFSLPTEAEWEYAAKGGLHRDTFLYSGSHSIDEVAVYGNKSSNIKKDAADAVYTVASKAPNSLGIYDMSGNVYEWCSDWYSRQYPTDLEVNPKGESEGRFRVVRGGCWSSAPHYCRTSKRVYVAPKKRYSNVGMRLCLRK